MNQGRQPKGIPSGGQFAAAVNAEADVDLDGGEPACAFEEDPLAEARAEGHYEDVHNKYCQLQDLAYPADDPDGKVDPAAFESAFRPAAIVDHAHRIYEYMIEHNVGVDSATRGAAFEYAAAATGRDYETFYQAWRQRKPIGGEASR